MNARARGFTLVEMLIVSIMLTLVMGAVYQTLISQQQNTRHLSAVINSHQTNRTSTQYLAGELREIGTRLARDITSATSSRVTFRAMRKVGFVCQNNAGNIDVYSLGGDFVAGDSIVVYADQNTQAMADDTTVSDVPCPSSSTLAQKMVFLAVSRHSSAPGSKWRSF